MNWLVVNADDAGLDEATDAAILRCAREGVVRSVSVVVAGPTASAFVERALRAGLDLGLHINLTEGQAVAGPAPTLTDARGRLRGPKGEVWRRAAGGDLEPEAVQAEVRAQWDRLRSLGAKPSHLDGHNHVHVFPVVREALLDFGPDVWVRVPDDVFCDLDARPDLPETLETWTQELRGPWRKAGRFTGFDFSRHPTLDVFLRSVAEPAAVLEFMVHPGRRPGSAFSASSLRDREAQTLCSSVLREELQQRGWRIASFRELPCASPL